MRGVKTPLFLRLFLILFAIRMRRILAIIGLHWIFLIVVIMFLGGIIVVFIHASSLNFRKKNIFHLNFPNFIFTWGLLFLRINALSLRSETQRVSTAAAVYRTQSTASLWFFAFYLLLALLLLVKIVCPKEGPIKTHSF